MPVPVKYLISVLLLAIPGLSMAVSLGTMQLRESNGPFHAQVTVQLAAGESPSTLAARLAMAHELPSSRHLNYPLNRTLALAVSPLGEQQVLLDIRGGDEKVVYPFSFLLQLQLNNGMLLKQYDVTSGGLMQGPEVRETLLSHIFSHDGDGRVAVSTLSASGKVGSPEVEVQQLQQELADARNLERDLKQQNQMLKENIQQMEKLAGDIAQQLGLFAQMRQQANDGAPIFIDQGADSSFMSGTTLGSISVLALLMAGFAFREKLKLTELVEHVKRLANALFKHNKAL